MSFAGQSHSYCLFRESMHCGWTGVEEKEPCLQIKFYMEKWNFWLTWILALWLGIPEDKEINTAMQDKETITCKCKKNFVTRICKHSLFTTCKEGQSHIWNPVSVNTHSAKSDLYQCSPAITVLTHSYNRDMAEVLWERRTVRRNWDSRYYWYAHQSKVILPSF